jgi:large subunit ribosomal protein L5
MIHLKEKYKKEIVPKIREKFGYKNIMAVPRLEKVVVNTGFGKLTVSQHGDDQKKTIESIVNDLAMITGQKPLKTKAKKPISTFSLRKGMIIGAKVTLRKQKMYDFLERLIHMALPRTRDFRGLSPDSVDKKGSLTIGIKEHICFPEVSPEKAKSIFGMEITVATSAKSKEEGLELFRQLGFPIKK